MAASQHIPEYTVYIVSGNKKYNVTSALLGLDRAEPKGQIAQRVNLQLACVQVDNSHLSNILKARDRVIIYADDGTRNEEVFRGYLWSRVRTDSTSEKEIEYTCYDNLIYFQESEDSLYFSAGKSTRDIVSSICNKWGIPLRYSYESITHTKMPLRGRLSDIFTSSILDLVKKRTKRKYVILSERDTMVVKPVGANFTAYNFVVGKNISKTVSGWTMEGVITQVIILGKADDNDRSPIEATVSGNTSKYATLQSIQNRSEGTSLADAKLEARNTIDENGKPKCEYEITGPDVPWIRKGDRVHVLGGSITESKIVTDINRTYTQTSTEMTLTLEDDT